MWFCNSDMCTSYFHHSHMRPLKTGSTAHVPFCCHYLLACHFCYRFWRKAVGIKCLVGEWIGAEAIYKPIVPSHNKCYKCQWWFGCWIIVFSCYPFGWHCRRDFQVIHFLMYGVIKAGVCPWEAVLHKAILRKTGPVSWAHSHYWRCLQIYYWKWY